MKRSPQLPTARLVRIPRSTTLIAKILIGFVPFLGATAADPYQRVSMELAHTFLQSEATDADALVEFKRKESVTGEKFNNAVDKAVKLGRTLIEEGVAADSKYFSRLLAEGLGVPSTGGGKQPIDNGKNEEHKASKQNETAKAEAMAAKSLWLEGWEYYHDQLTPSQRKAFADKNHIAEEDWKSALAKSGPTAPVESDDKPAEYSHADRLLISMGYRSKKENGDPSDAETTVNLKAQPSVQLEGSFGTKTDGISRFFQAGYRQLTPYSVSGSGTEEDPLKLIEADKDGTAFIEFVYSNRWAWNPERIFDASGTDANDGILTIPSFLPELRDPFSHEYIDFDARFSYNFSDFDDASAAAIAGGSDVSAEFSLSRHLGRHEFSNKSAYSVNLELGYGITSDAAQFDAHQRYFAGLGYNASFEAPGNSGRSGLFSMRVGWSKIDNVVFSDDESPNLLGIRDGRIAYEMDDAIALETELIYPFGDSAALTFGARIYGAIDPNTWSVHIGYTKPITELFGGLFPTSSNGAKPEDHTTNTMGQNP